MESPLGSYAQYVHSIYSLLADRPTVASHTLAVYTVSQTIGITRGHVVFRSGHVLDVFEQIDFVSRRILKYFYGLISEGETLWWYDPMPHPDVHDLQGTHPHHKHIPPDIKHLRIPAPGMSFTEPNLPRLLQEVESLIEGGPVMEGQS
jgi:hypothetical protein